jgi:hypothetical protein
VKPRSILFSILCLFSYITNIQSEGFVTGTLVKTPSQYSYIEELKSQDKVISLNLSHHSHANTSIITKTINYQSDSYIKIIIGDSIICCALDQKLYSYNQQKWIKADKLTYTDILINDKYEPVFIDSIEIIQQSCKFQALALTPHHTYCVSPHNIVVHNTGPVMVVYLPAIVSTITPIVETLLATVATFFGIQFFAKKVKQKQFASHYNYSSSNNSGSYYPDPNDPHDDKNKRNDKEHPHGIYKDAPYHHKNSSGSKSQSPKNGQRCLDYSLPTETNQRVAIEGENLILLKYTSPGNYHGHVVTWKQLDQNIRSILIKNGFVRNSGKIIRQITEKYQL